MAVIFCSIFLLVVSIALRNFEFVELQMERGMDMNISKLVSDLLDEVTRRCENDSSSNHEAKSMSRLHKRRKIRKIMHEETLPSVTLDARQQEKERIERLRQLKEQSGSPNLSDRREEKANACIPCDSKNVELDVIVISDDDDNDVEDVTDQFRRGVHRDFTNDKRNEPDSFGRLLINVGHPKNDPDVFVPTHLANIIKPHQFGGIRFLYENVVETLHLFETTNGFGCILAHSMGLGKTLQVIVFVNVLLEVTKAQKVLIIVPLNTLQNWIHEFERWLPKIPEDKSVKPRQFDIFVLNDTLKTTDQRCCVVEDWHKQGGVLIMGYEIFRILVSSDLAGVNRKRKKRKRNGEDGETTEVIDIEEEELHQSLAQKMRTALLNPGPAVVICDEGHRIKNINNATSRTLNSIRTRRSHTLLKNILPKKTEYVILLRKSPVQHTLYRRFLEHFQGSLNVEGLCFNPIKAFAVCCKIWNHPDILKKFMDKSEKYASDKDLELSEVKSGGTYNSCDKPATASRPDVEIPAKLRRVNNSSHNLLLPSNYDWAEEVMINYKTNCLENGYKMVIAMSILRHGIKMGDKILLFSQSLFTLNLIEEYLAKGICTTGVKWKRNKNYFRLDGSTSALERQRLISRFNNEPGIHLFLISTRAGSLGINLCGANRVIVFDASWNPCHDAQAVCRIYRYGQRKPCFVYRLVTDNSMEKAIFSRQIGKQGISDRVIDEKHVDLHVTREELQNLMNYDEAKDLITGEWDSGNWVLDDSLLHQICKEQSSMLSQEPIKHESLLLDSADAELTDQEKKEAERSYTEEIKLMRGKGEPLLSAGFSIGQNTSSTEHFPSQQPRQKVQPAVAVVRPLKATPFPMKLEPTGTIHRSGFTENIWAPSVHHSFPSSAYASYRPLRPILSRSYSDHSLAHRETRPPLPPPPLHPQPPVLHHVVTTDSTLPSITYPGMLFPVPPGQMATLVRTSMGIYLRLQDGHVLDARGSFYDNGYSLERGTVSGTPMDSSSEMSQVHDGTVSRSQVTPSCSSDFIDLCDSSDEES